MNKLPARLQKTMTVEGTIAENIRTCDGFSLDIPYEWLDANLLPNEQVTINNREFLIAKIEQSDWDSFYNRNRTTIYFKAV